MVGTAWKCLVQNWPPDSGPLGCTVTVADSWLVHAGWPLGVVVVAVLRRRDV
ncbi:hypothetical protein [Streptomyces mirabilis]|uniref:hypothetical protein n=1 Tax=Streptomyces mirabilis TaxID=68239 RepID=UPI0036DDC7BF